MHVELQIPLAALWGRWPWAQVPIHLDSQALAQQIEAEQEEDGHHLQVHRRHASSSGACHLQGGRCHGRHNKAMKSAGLTE